MPPRAHGLGVHEQVTSPTFAIYSIYHGTSRRLVHLDAYRLENEAQLEPLLLEEFLTSPWCLAVEWPEKTGAWLPQDAWHLTLSIVDGDRRLHPDAIARTLAVLDRYGAVARDLGVTAMRATATRGKASTSPDNSAATCAAGSLMKRNCTRLIFIGAR